MVRYSIYGIRGKGYAGEALKGIIDFAFSNTEFRRLEAFHREANKQSGRVLEKSNMKVVDSVERFRRKNKKPNGEKCYAITKKEWEAKKNDY